MKPNTQLRLPGIMKGLGKPVPEMVLLDVGCSGGIETVWNPILPWITAYAVDPLVNEIERLRAAEKTGRVHYLDGFITGPAGYELPKNPPLSWFGEVSALAAHKFVGANFIQQVFNAGAEVLYSQNRLSVDALLARESVDRIDFLKTDTDGYDHAVLDGARSALKRALGVNVEASFPTENGGSVFRDIDRLLAEEGFVLAGVSPAFYTRAALPGRFNHPAMADEDRGAPSWAEFVYLRDVNTLPADLDTVLRFAIFAELLGVPDLAAQALLTVRAEHQELVTPLLDGLVAYSGLPDAGSYDELMAAFQKDPGQFATGQYQRGEFVVNAAEMQARIDSLETKLSLCKKMLAKAEEDLSATLAKPARRKLW